MSALVADHGLDSVDRRFLKEAEQHHVEQQQRGVVGDRVEPEDLREDHEQDREQQQRSDQRPDEAEHRAVVAELELGLRGQPQEVEEAAGPAAERRGSVDVLQALVAGLNDGAHGEARTSAAARGCSFSVAIAGES